ncbi:hypothetical protein FF100_31650 [Methylobacterium terricola]|uniref:Lipoprotein n=1 Tax=Methylobacterium terricola TaxID=2583531 RepID=A0A5C4L705_9HYPH|nr:hypothetical protein [Methylobacterium terricola]TNC07638.1 hypothetical protein FF100_31650 [Methylobacterium terricola]
MRIAVLIIGLCLSFAIFLQSCAVSFGADVAKNQDLAEGGALGVLVALLFIIGAAFALGLPRLSGSIFLLAGLIGNVAGRTTKFHDLNYWGAAALILSLMAFLGNRELRKSKMAKKELSP